MRQSETIGKIETRELAEHLLGGVIVGERGLYSSFKRAEIYLLSVFFDVGLISSFWFVEPNAFEWEPGTWSLASISTVPGIIAKPEVFSSVVEAVAVLVIHENAFWRFYNEPVQQDRLISPAFPTAINAHAMLRVDASLGAYRGGPFVLTNPLEIIVINDCDIAASEGYLTHG